MLPRQLNNPEDICAHNLTRNHSYFYRLFYFSFNYFKNEYSSNQWHEAFFPLHPTKVDFQIVFEAIADGGRICDIAIDDVSLLHGSDCSLETTSEAITEESDGIYDIQSCKNRCNETESAIINSLDKFIHDENYNLIERCDCHFDCDDMDTCCPDYQLQCNTSKNDFIK